ncbi:MAG TPA: hypothetical protein PLE45_10335 [Spirochaetota bacterium]|nr:hypothetical protein [Spirochaetota bacterium]HPP04086.1 hypothetical protein [Spirochaetota bacterium]
MKIEIERLKKSKEVVVNFISPDIPCQSDMDDYFLLKFNLNFCQTEIKFL